MSAPSPIANRAALLIGCPQCNNLVTLPAAIALQAIVRCPICHSTFPVHSALPSNVPELQVVSQENVPFQQPPPTSQSRMAAEEDIRLSPDEKLPVAKALREGARRRRHGRHQSIQINESAEVSQPLFDPQASEQIRSTDQQTQAVLSGQSPSLNGPNYGGHIRGSQSHSPHSRSSRSRSAKINTIVEIAKVVAGALLALPVSQLIIWWGLGLDPFGIGPSIGRVAPFVVPAKLQQPPTPIERPPSQKT